MEVSHLVENDTGAYDADDDDADDGIHTEANTSTQ
jgi:hypothetical protein